MADGGSTTFRFGVYVGPIEQLRGETAMLRSDGKTLWAEFDDFELCHPETGAALGLGWHPFDEGDFQESLR